MEEAMVAYLAKRKRETPRPEAVACFRAGAARNRRLMELLAQCVGSSQRVTKQMSCTIC